MALAFRRNSLSRFKLFSLRSEVAHTVFPQDCHWTRKLSFFIRGLVLQRQKPWEILVSTKVLKTRTADLAPSHFTIKCLPANPHPGSRSGWVEGLDLKPPFRRVTSVFVEAPS